MSLRLQVRLSYILVLIVIAITLSSLNGSALVSSCLRLPLGPYLHNCDIRILNHVFDVHLQQQGTEQRDTCEGGGAIYTDRYRPIPTKLNRRHLNPLRF